MVKREGNDDWAVWCNHVLFELERLDREATLAKKKAFAAWVLSLIVQAQLFVGGIALGYLIKVVIELLNKP